MLLSSVLTRRQFLGTAAAAAGVLAAPAALTAAEKPKKLVLLAGTPSHGPGQHEFNAGVLLLKKCLAKTPGLDVVTQLNGWPKDEKVFEGADAILCFADGGGGHPLLKGGLEYVGGLMRKGVGLMCAHYGVEVPKDRGGKEFQEWIGGYYETNWSCNPHWTAEVNELAQHPITRGVKPFSVKDEWYFNMRFRPEMKGVTPILSAKPSDAVRKGPYASPRGPYQHIIDASGRSEALMWATERIDGGRGVGFTGGHYHENWLNDDFRKVVLNALLWISKVEVPKEGVESKVSMEEIKENLDRKGK
jgi:hypothetical protein